MSNLEQPKEQISLEQLKRKLWDKYDIERNKKVLEFAAKLREKYADCTDYRLWYILAGGTPDYEGEEKYDFPGEDSIEEFINSLD